jgi:hypothetical protein
MKIGFRVAPYDQNPPRIIEVNDISSAEEEIKKYMVSPNLVFKYWIEPDDKESMVKNTKYR